MKRTKMLSRRGFLAGGGVVGAFSWLAFDPVRQLLASMVRGQIEASRSKFLKLRLTAQPTRNFVQFNLYGSPTRWMFDHVLRPNDNDPFVQCRGVYNRILQIDSSAPHLSTGFYSDIKMRGINMPHLWQYPVAKAGGGTRPMSELMEHMLTIRGCDIGMNAHPINCAKQVSPLPGDISITGLVADATNAFIPAVGVGRTPANRAFKSPKLTSVIDIPPEEDDYISYLMNAFYQTPPTSPRSTDEAIDDALNALRAYGLSNNPGADILYNERRRAEQLMRQGVDQLADAFGPLHKKYSDLFSRSMALSPLPGVTDQALPPLNFPFEVPGDVDLLSGLCSHHVDGRIVCPTDLRDMFSKATSQGLPKHFALAEFLLTEGLSSSIVLASPAERGQILKGINETYYFPVEAIKREFDQKRSATTFSVDAQKRQKYPISSLLHDSHRTGWLTNVVSCNLFYRGLSSCMLELIDRLKEVQLSGGTLFDETVIQLASEFDRIPDFASGGATHYPAAHVTSLYSGIVAGPTLLGNIYVGRKADPWSPPGTVGTAAPVPSLINRIISINNISSTLSEMLRVPRIVRRAVPLVSVKGNRLTPTIEAARNVEDEVV